MVGRHWVTFLRVWWRTYRKAIARPWNRELHSRWYWCCLSYREASLYVSLRQIPEKDTRHA